MHIMLFGGAFDPPHNGHLEIATGVVVKKIADEVWFVPCATHPFGKKMSPVQDRIAMLESVGTLKIETYEAEQKATSFTVETVKHYSQTMPQHSFSWLIGSDQLPGFTRWERWEELLALCKVYVYPRKDHPFDALQPNMMPLRELPEITISSTKIRALVASGEPFEHLVPEAVASYIREKNCYVPA